jgi:hypothetical protein
MIEAGLTTYLETHAVLKPLLAGGGLTRVFPLMIPEHVRSDPTALPCVVYQRVGSTRGGTFCSTDSLASVTLQLDMYSRSYLSVKQLAIKVRRALVDYTGPMGDTHVDKVFIDVEFDIIETDTGLYRVSHTYTFWVQEE